jgi:uncharacterized Zn finger protein
MATKPKEPELVLSRWKNLSWDDLTDWTGSKTLSRGRGYANSQHVSQLARTDDGMLLAWVQGTERYATHVQIHAADKNGETLTSQCSCPVGYRCKHAVAVILSYLDVLRASVKNFL